VAVLVLGKYDEVLLFRSILYTCSPRTAFWFGGPVSETSFQYGWYSLTSPQKQSYHF
jgi:hypothetical protein